MNQQADVKEELPVNRANVLLERAKDLSLAGGNSSIEQERMIRDLYKAISYIPDQIPHYMFLGKLYRQALDIASSIFCYRFVLNIQPTNLQARKLLSELLVIRGQEQMVTAASVKSILKFQSARACFDEALEVNKEDTDAWICKSVCHVHVGELTEAHEAITRAMKTPLKPTAEMYILRAKIYWGRGLTEQGNVDIRVAAMLDSSHPEVISFFNRSFMKAEVLYKESVNAFTEGKYKEALLAVNHAMHITTEDVKLLILQSKIYRMLGELQSAYDSMLRAKAIFEKAFEGTEYPMELPSDIKLQINLILNDMSLDYASKGNYEKAILLLNKIIKTEETMNGNGLIKVNHRYYINRGDCHRALNLLADAIYDYNLALNIKSDDWEIKTRLSLTHYLIGTIYFNQSQFQETKLEFDKAILYNPKVTEYYIIRGRTHYYLSNYKQAYSDFKRALQLDENNIEVKEWLSQFDDEHQNNNNNDLSVSKQKKNANTTTSSSGNKNAKKIDFTKVSSHRDPSTVRSVHVSPEDTITMMLLPKYATKLPTLKMLTGQGSSSYNSSNSGGNKYSIQKPLAQKIQEKIYIAKNYSPRKHTTNNNISSNNTINSTTTNSADYSNFPHINTTTSASPYALNENNLMKSYEAVIEVQKKNNKLKEIIASASEGVSRGPLWELVETAKQLAYEKSHPKQNRVQHTGQNSSLPQPPKKNSNNNTSNNTSSGNNAKLLLKTKPSSAPNRKIKS